MAIGVELIATCDLCGAENRSLRAAPGDMGKMATEKATPSGWFRDPRGALACSQTCLDKLKSR